MLAGLIGALIAAGTPNVCMDMAGDIIMTFASSFMSWYHISVSTKNVTHYWVKYNPEGLFTNVYINTNVGHYFYITIPDDKYKEDKHE